MSTYRRLAASRELPIALIVYCAGLIVGALTPDGPIGWLGWTLAAVSAVAAIGLAGQLRSDPPRASRWAYLLTGFAGLGTLAAYLLLTADPEPVRWSLGLILATGTLAAYGTHISEGRGL